MTVAAFEEMIQKATTPAVLVDFCTTWCGPCQMLAKNMRVLQPTMNGRVQFEKIDTEEHPEVAEHFSVHKLPTLILFKGGQQVDRYEGLLSAQDLELRLRKFLM